ncbi:hypothetical protein [Sulfurimonas sp.]
MSNIFLSPEVSIELFLELLLLLVLSFTLLHSLYILKNYKAGETTTLQYSLEKKSYLVSVVISVSFSIKILLLIFFVYLLDELSFIIPGAMCGAGVISSNEYGEPLLFLKLVILLLSSLWLVLNKKDLLEPTSPYFKKKMFYFIAIYILFFLEFILSLKFFILIDTQSLVLCCASIYTEDLSSNPLPFNMSKLQLIFLFYTLYCMLMLSAYKKQKVLLLFLSFVFVYLSYYAIVYFFSAYIYELPTHKCPFCMLQMEYNYIGYFIYISLSIAIYKTFTFSYNKIILYYSLFVIILSYPLISYLMGNKTLL